MGEYNVELALAVWLKGAERVVVAGIGNQLRSDDFVGMKIVRDLKGNVSGKVLLVECETLPESFIDEISGFRPTHILVVDAALLGEPPGSVRLVKDLGDISPVISTHIMPLQIFCEYLRATTMAKVALLAIQPEENDFGEGLTEKVEDSANKLVGILERVLSRL